MFKDITKFKLKPEMVPDSCWYSNLRSALPKKAWDIIRKHAYARANGKCEICGAKCSRLEAHENWSYDEKNHVQKLENVVAICPACHSVIHIGRTQLMGNEKKAIAHFCKVNDCSYADYIRTLGQANADHQRRNLVPEWKLDASYLTTLFNGDKNGEKTTGKSKEVGV